MTLDTPEETPTVFGRLDAARQKAADTAYLYSGHPDIYIIQVFDCGPDGRFPEVDAIVDQVAANVCRLPMLQVKLAVDPFGVDLPYRVRDDAPIESHIVDIPVAGKTWHDCMPQLASLTTVRLDPFDALWRLHILRGVVGVPQSSGPATVAVLQVAHCAADGQGAAAFARRLLSTDDAEPAPVEYLNSPPGVRHSAIGVLRSVGLLARLAYELLDQRLRRGHSQNGRVGPDATEHVAAPAVGDGVVHVEIFVVPLTLLRSNGLTVTLTMLIAISVAMERYLREIGRPDASYYGNVPVVIPESFVPGAENLVTGAHLDLHVGVSSLVERRELIRSGLASAVAEATGTERESAFRLTNRAPAPILRRFMIRESCAALRNPLVARMTKLTSYSVGNTGVTLAGAPILFTSSMPGMGGGLTTGHEVVGMGDAVGVAITATGSAIPDIHRYSTILRAAIDEVSVLAMDGAGGASVRD